MTQAAALQFDDSFDKDLPTSYMQQHWYAAYTCANHENRVASELQLRSVEHFLPLYRSVRRWRDRRVRLELPLFPGYVFVRLALCDRLRVLQVPSVVRLVGFGGLPTAVPDDQVENPPLRTDRTLECGTPPVPCRWPQGSHFSRPPRWARRDSFAPQGSLPLRSLA